MGTDYSTPTTQTVNGIAPSSWANNVNDDLEAIFEPPSARFVAAAAGPSGLAASNPDPLVAGSYGAVYWMASNENEAGRTDVESSGQTWQRLVASTSGSGRSFCDDTSSTWSGATISTGTGDDVTPTDFLKVPNNGLWLIQYEVGVALTATTGSLTVRAVLGSYTVSALQVPISGTGASGTYAGGSCVVKMTTSDSLKIEARPIGAGTTVNGGWLQLTRISRSW